MNHVSVYLLLLLSHFSHVRLCVTPQTAAHQAPPSLILQARTLEWVAISFSNAWKWKVKVKLLSRVRLLATPWTAAYQAPPSMGFSRQEYWSGMPLPSLRKDSGMNENEYTTYQNLWDAASVVLRGNFIAVNAYIKKKIHLKLITWPSILRN